MLFEIRRMFRLAEDIGADQKLKDEIDRRDSHSGLESQNCSRASGLTKWNAVRQRQFRHQLPPEGASLLYRIVPSIGVWFQSES
jgi:hypothetical protein